MTSQLFNYSLHHSTQQLVIELPSTMHTLPLPLPNTHNMPKFPKSNSFSTVYSQSDGIYERDLITRKVSQHQKKKMIALITAENYTMKDAAKYVNVSYSTAKKVFAKFRQDLKESLRKKANSRLCKGSASYRELQEADRDEIELVRVVSLVAGEQQRRTGNIVLIAHCDC